MPRTTTTVRWGCTRNSAAITSTKYITTDRVTLIYELPLAEVVTDFFDQMKTRTQGYASMECQPDRLPQESAGAPGCVDQWRTGRCPHHDRPSRQGLQRRQGSGGKLKVIPRQQFKIPIQASIGSRIIASTSISAIRKDVLAVLRR